MISKSTMMLPKTTIADLVSSSRQAIKKYIQSNNALGSTNDAQFAKHLNAAFSSGEKSGDFLRPKGPSGPVKLAKKDTSKASSPPAKTEKKPVVEKKTVTKVPAKKEASKVHCSWKLSDMT